MGFELMLQYTLNGILRYEWIFGDGFISAGGASVTSQLFDLIDWSPEPSVLDVGITLQ